MSDIKIQLGNLGRAIKTLRGKQTLVEVSIKSGFSISYLSDIERGVTYASLDALNKIAYANGRELYIVFAEEKDDTTEQLARVQAELENALAIIRNMRKKEGL